MNIVNCTPHTINHRPDVGVEIVYEYTGHVPRVNIHIEQVQEVPHLVRRTHGDVVGLPEPVEGTMYIVSKMVADAVRRPDLIVPVNFVREGGKIVACRSFEVIA
jgi:hypothetical protein